MIEGNTNEEDFEKRISAHSRDRLIRAMQGVTLTRKDALYVAEYLLMCVKPRYIKSSEEIKATVNDKLLEGK